MTTREKAWEPESGWHSPPGRGRVPGMLAAFVFFLLAALLIVGYQSTLLKVELVVDGGSRSVRTHQTTVEAVLREAGLTLHPEDVIAPPLSEPISAGATITIRRARPVLVQVDGRTVEARTHLTQTRQILAALGIKVNPHDKVQVLEKPSKDALPDASRTPTFLQPIRIQVERAVPVTLQESGSLPLRFYTTARTVGEALREAGIVLYLADEVHPSLSSPVKPGMRISIDRSVPVTIRADGQTFRTRTHRFTAAEVLADVGISLHGLDYAEPDLNTPLGEGQEITVVRVREEIEVQQEPIPFETQWAPDPDLEIDHQQVGQEGRPGIFERRIRVRYEDGVEVGRWVEAEWVAQAPQPKVLNYGTKVVLRTVNTPSGPKEYWRKYRMFATSYNAASSGKAPDHPYYGITAIGWQMRSGIVAVDPRVVPLRSRVYVPGYGIGDAADTGGAIRGLRIDLGYDDHNLVLWYRCVDVYMLAPVPDRVEYVVNSLVHPWCR